MSDDITFTDGMICKSPSAQAPDFIKVNLSFKVEEFIEFLQKNSKAGWVNVQVKESRAGKWYGAVDTWEPTKQEEYATGAKQAREAMAGERPPTAPQAPAGLPIDDIPF
jgi:hypothetical protein